jgi:hypothetical protein
MAASLTTISGRKVFLNLSFLTLDLTEGISVADGNHVNVYISITPAAKCIGPINPSDQ